MDEIERDLIDTESIIDGMDSKFHIYLKSNEYLEGLFKCFSVKDKKVLTVLGSSDQAFCSYYNGANSVDTFDRNRLAKHYYYLRKWLLIYEKKLYPEIEEDTDWIKDLLRLVKCNSLDETLSYKYWDTFASQKERFSRVKLFWRSSEFDNSGIEDISLLIDIIKDKELTFKCQDICKDIDKSSKYNVVIISNVLDYVSSDRALLIKCRDNLDDILENDGVIIGTRLMLERYPSAIESEVFNSKFVYRPFFADTDMGLNVHKVLGYCYKRR